jgi:predicted RNase H-like HicB family nuclease
MIKQTYQFAAVIEREEEGCVSLCPELDIASQGDTVEEARANLIESIELFFEIADPSEITNRLKSVVLIVRLGVSIGQA